MSPVIPRKTKRRKVDSAATTLLQFHLQELFPGEQILREYHFHPVRSWRFDFCVSGPRLAIEIEGGIWIGGGHNRGKIYQQNLDKYNQATLLGYALFRFSPQDIERARDVEVLRQWRDAAGRIQIESREAPSASEEKESESTRSGVIYNSHNFNSSHNGRERTAMNGPEIIKGIARYRAPCDATIVDLCEAYAPLARLVDAARAHLSRCDCAGGNCRECRAVLQALADCEAAAKGDRT